MTPGRPVPPPLAKPLPDLTTGTTDSTDTLTPGPSLAAAYGATASDSGLVPLTVARRAPKDDDVEIAIEFCGLCHSDVHATRGEWGTQNYPLVPGHEIVGRVSRVGSAVDEFSLGERVGVGCLVDSCRECESCLDGLEQYCENGMTGTYGAKDRRNGDAITQGGYATSVVVDRRYVLHIPDGLDPAAAAPLLCAGITTYSPLRHFGLEAGDVVGVVGLGGLGHMAVKLAKAMGAEVKVFTTSESKVAAARELGADDVILSRDEAAMDAANRSIDVIIDTVAAPHDLNPYFRTLRVNGALFQLGLPSEEMPPVNPGALIRRRIAYAGSLIGGIAETQEMLDFCAEHGVTSDIEVVRADQLNAAYDRMVAGDVKYRFVLDTSTLGTPSERADA
ncbi:NAD(P)-dependent alcohol dehydrogenase [Arthrobacter sp. AL08]|uniref:NAD(P)-dependent alcohol dehydrogenase n=1 Tax=unclassified Arthrobacter TaxID=235627 RepID=UPI00209713DC|nr:MULTISPECIES: NAD(P)-dependent alcohol dehydrogenase [unclassified Arthrobacter]MDD1477112.1 NAD(P)-dependent alcohol dehydrogenase [Arthrobacter sp. H16F315]MDI3242625.1 NAD(P)-dependent alcohol dehydrogenase [Arthrobacter sp. AL05]MDI3278644.1 NAD(P)-dependent alcohol dehydrogenase [Arthrobacter sp. AL08]